MTQLTNDQACQAERILRRWQWAGRLSAPTDRAVERAAVAELAVGFLAELLDDAGSRHSGYSGHDEAHPRAA